MTKRRLFAGVAVWAASAFVALVCLRSGLMKMPGVPGAEFWARDFQRWGYPGWFRVAVGAAELAASAALLVPRAAAYGAALFALVMVGAIVTHAGHGETGRLPFNAALLALSVGIAAARLTARPDPAARPR
jgi:uncharacterized membrane protein YphA (DoxX/SURF4 family)